MTTGKDTHKIYTYRADVTLRVSVILCKRAGVKQHKSDLSYDTLPRIGEAGTIFQHQNPQSGAVWTNNHWNTKRLVSFQGHEND